MEDRLPTREDAWALLNAYNSNESLIRHALAVEAVMRHFARLLGGDENLWGIIGLIHDLDYERYPDQHCTKTFEILTENNWPADAALVRPSRSILDMDAKSVKKKWKDKRFAAGVDRAIIEKGAALLGMDIGELITETILGMRPQAEVLGLNGMV